MEQHEISVELINIDQIDGAREQLVAMNDGYASVPTIIFPDGEKLVEPSLKQLKVKLGIEEKGVLDRILGALWS